jgi:proline iminopeptidase
MRQPGEAVERVHRPRGLLRLLAVVVAAGVAGLLGLVGVASVSDRPSVFLGAGLVVFLAATAAGVALATRKLPGDRRRRARLDGFAAGALVGVAAFMVTALLPVGDPRLTPAPVPGQRWWELPTGSRLAWVRLPAQGPRRPTPVVFLHGGPGIADMAGDAASFGRLTGDGYDVFIYDQVGTGRSNRLEDPNRYTIAREVADLEAMRRRIGADRVVLIGHSWGGQVAASYPRLYAPLVRPRVLLGYTLLQVNPRAGTHCRDTGPGPALHGLGFYTYQFPQSAAARPWADPRPALARLHTPALVIKGSCDYLSWSSGLAYRRALPGAELVYLRHAGHNAYQDQPAAYLAVVRAFLAGRPLPTPPRTGDDVPADYEGPP